MWRLGKEIRYYKQANMIGIEDIMIRKATQNVLLVLGVIGIFLVSAVSASALTISPARIETASDPGQTIEGEYMLINEQNEEKTFYSTFENFESQGETGAPNFVTATEGLATWINSPKEITLGPGKSVKLKYQITIPKDAEAGGHFAAIFWGTTNPNTASGQEQVTIGAKIGVLILLRVNGDIKEGGGIENFQTTDAQRFYTVLPVDFFYRFKNTGADRIKPVGEVAIKNTFGLTTSVLNANPQDGNVLPQSTRKYTLTWNGTDDNDNQPDKRLDPPQGFFFGPLKYEFQHFALGVYVAKVHLSYGEATNLTDTKSFFFFVFPWQLVLVILLGAIVLWRGLKAYNSMIIKRAQQVQTPLTSQNEKATAAGKK